MLAGRTKVASYLRRTNSIGVHNVIALLCLPLARIGQPIAMVSEMSRENSRNYFLGFHSIEIDGLNEENNCVDVLVTSIVALTIC